ncbi:MAG TPA: GxxExxY protein [Opitutaceae bacterium]|nr:GxxExxY protein [Opitutaceae bacterium]
MELVAQELTDRLLSAAVAVHRELGPGFLESFYEAALAHELTKRGHRVERQKLITVQYDGVVVGEHRLDLFVDGAIVLELKACKAIEDVHLAVARSYLKAVGVRVALVLNFAEARLGVRRVVW